VPLPPITNADTNPVTQLTPGPQSSHEGKAQLEDEAVNGLQLRQTRKANIINLNVCICGVTITKHEIQDNAAVMKCRVAGCETVWVSEPSIQAMTLVTHHLFSSIWVAWTMNLYPGNGPVRAVGQWVAADVATSYFNKVLY
jgi:hypothetical protein